MDYQQHKLEKYILHNQIADSYTKTNDATKQYLLDKTMGRTASSNSGMEGGAATGTGGSCANTKINDGLYKWTMLKYTGNQKTVSKELRGGRVSLPLQYFGKDTGGYSGAVKTTKMSDIKPALARPGLSSTFSGGGNGTTTKTRRASNIFSLNDVHKMHHGGNVSDFKLSQKQQYDLLKQYNENVKTFLHEVNELSGGGSRPITKSAVNKALAKMKSVLA